MNERRADTSKFTFYNIPTKMLYDPAPQNDLSDPGHDMSAYAEYSGGVKSFTYRQRRRQLNSRQLPSKNGTRDTARDSVQSRRQLASASVKKAPPSL